MPVDTSLFTPAQHVTWSKLHAVVTDLSQKLEIESLSFTQKAPPTYLQNRFSASIESNKARLEKLERDYLAEKEAILAKIALSEKNLEEEEKKQAIVVKPKSLIKAEIALKAAEEKLEQFLNYAGFANEKQNERVVTAGGAAASGKKISGKLETIPEVGVELFEGKVVSQFEKEQILKARQREEELKKQVEKMLEVEPEEEEEDEYDPEEIRRAAEEQKEKLRKQHEERMKIFAPMTSASKLITNTKLKKPFKIVNKV